MTSLSGKKVLFVITKSNWGGAQSYVHTMATAAHHAGATVAVALGGTGLPGADTGILKERLEKSGVRTIHLKSLARDVSLIREFRAFAEFRALLKEERPDVLHLNSSKVGGLGALAGHLEGVTTILYTAHGWAHREPRPFPIRVLIWLSSWLTVLLTDRTIVVSKRDERGAPAVFLRRKLVYIPNGIRAIPLEPKEDARQILARTYPSLAHFPHWLLIVAEQHYNKGIDVALRALSELPRTDTALILIGSGEERTLLEQLAESLQLGGRVFFFGFIEEARRLLPAADIVLLPSRKEGLPFGLLEAATAGTAVIASNTGGIPEIIENLETGLLVPVGDALALRDALQRLLEDGQLRHALSSALTDHVRANYAEEHMIRDTLELY